MALRGHYFKHSERGNIVTRTIEANNYWNMASMLYAANCILIPLVKLSFAGHHGMTPPDASGTRSPFFTSSDITGHVMSRQSDGP